MRHRAGRWTWGCEQGRYSPSLHRARGLVKNSDKPKAFPLVMKGCMIEKHRMKAHIRGAPYPDFESSGKTSLWKSCLSWNLQDKGKHRLKEEEWKRQEKTAPGRGTLRKRERSLRVLSQDWTLAWASSLRAEHNERQAWGVSQGPNQGFGLKNPRYLDCNLVTPGYH